uniref:N-(5'-phosphoribosyl)anthranilate isomerase n=1 Tax=Dictyoglomus turgidum TaxID=513050 RepID=A0A7C3SNC4_9BACT
MWIKICGITDIITALHCEIEGVSAIGLVFVPWSPRFISFEKLKKLSPHLNRLKIMKIGVFMNQKEEEIKKILDIISLDGIQFHGDESLEFMKKFKDYFLIKAINIDLYEDWDEKVNYFSQFSYVLLDRSKNSTLSFEEFLSRAKRVINSKTIIAGGIREENVYDVLKLRPFGIDLSSGVEYEVGKKDLLKISKFMRKVRDFSYEDRKTS